MKIVFVGAIWCNSCLVAKPIVNKIIQEYSDIIYEEYDFDTHKDIVEKYNLDDALPAIIFESTNWQVLKKHIWEISEKQLKNNLKELFNID